MGSRLNQTRGDTGNFTFQCLDTQGAVITAIADAIYFTVKTSWDTAPAVIRKTIDDMTFDDDGTYHFTIEPEDTEGLRYGLYVYDIEVTRDGVVTTIAKGKLAITEESTWAINKE